MTITEAALAAHVERLREALGMSRPWPVFSTLPIEAAGLLLGRHNYDGHGYELIEAAVEAGRRIDADLRAALAATPAESLAEHDALVRAATLREAADIVSALEPTWSLSEDGAYVRAAEELRASADDVEREGKP